MTTKELFGDKPWLDNPGGNGPYGPYPYNPIYFATKATAKTVAKALGGVVEEDYALTPYGSFRQNQPNQMVRMPILQADVDAEARQETDNRGYIIDPKGRLINAGLIADMFNHGYVQSNIDKMISIEVGFSFSWPTT